MWDSLGLQRRQNETDFKREGYIREGKKGCKLAGVTTDVSPHLTEKQVLIK